MPSRSFHKILALQIMFPRFYDIQEVLLNWNMAFLFIGLCFSQSLKTFVHNTQTPCMCHTSTNSDSLLISLQLCDVKLKEHGVHATVVTIPLDITWYILEEV